MSVNSYRKTFITTQTGNVPTPTNYNPSGIDIVTTTWVVTSTPTTSIETSTPTVSNNSVPTPNSTKTYTTTAPKTYTVSSTATSKVTVTPTPTPTTGLTITPTPTIGLTITPTPTPTICCDGISGLADKGVDNVINNHLEPENSGTSEAYTKSQLKNNYGFTEEQIDTYFKKTLVVLYKLNMYAIQKEFPNLAIRDIKDLKNAIEFGSVGSKNSASEFLNNLENKTVKKEEFTNYLNDYIILLNKENDNKEFTSAFFATVTNFAKEEILLTIDDEINLKEGIDKFIKILEDLLSKSAPEYKVKKSVFSSKKVNLFGIEISNSKFLKNLDEIANSENMQAKYLAQLFIDTFERLNLTKDEKEIFTQRIFDAIAKKIGGYEKGNSEINFSELVQLDNNGNGSWFDELHTIIQKEASKIDANVDRNPKTVDAKELTNIFGRLSAEDFIEDFEDLLLSDDGGVRKFAQMIDNAITRNGIYNDYDREDFVKAVFKLLNDAAGNSSSFTLKKSTINKLNESDIFATLEQILRSDELLLLYELDYDGDIDEFKQCGTGDCWLLAGILSLNATINGRMILKDALTFNPDNSVTVHFKGVGVSYTITAEEILEAEAHHSSSRAYAEGDNDVLIFELATEKLRRDIDAGNVEIKEGGVYDNYSSKDNGQPGEGITSGWPEQFVYFLTGKKADYLRDINLLKEQDVINFLNVHLESFIEDDFALSFALLGGVYNATTVDGETFNLFLDGAHALSIVDLTEDTITIVNPWDSEKKYTFTWEEFAKLGLYSVSATQL